MKRQSTAGRPEYSNIAEAPEKDLKNSFMKIIEVLKEEMKKVLKEIKEKTNWKESTNLLKNAKKAKKEQTGQGNYSRHENWNRSNKESMN